MFSEANQLICQLINQFNVPLYFPTEELQVWTEAWAKSVATSRIGLLKRPTPLFPNPGTQWYGTATTMNNSLYNF